jgi:hypothetical protein
MSPLFVVLSIFYSIHSRSRDPEALTTDHVLQPVFQCQKPDVNQSGKCGFKPFA